MYLARHPLHIFLGMPGDGRAQDHQRSMAGCGGVTFGAALPGRGSRGARHSGSMRPGQAACRWVHAAASPRPTATPARERAMAAEVHPTRSDRSDRVTSGFKKMCGGCLGWFRYLARHPPHIFLRMPGEGRAQDHKRSMAGGGKKSYGWVYGGYKYPR